MTVNFDNAATTYPKPPEVRRAVADAVVRYGNAGRGGHVIAERTSELVYHARETVAEFFDAKVENTIFTLNCTHALNVAIQGHSQIRRPCDLQRSGTQLGLPSHYGIGTGGKGHLQHAGGFCRQQRNAAAAGGIGSTKYQGGGLHHCQQRDGADPALSGNRPVLPQPEHLHDRRRGTGMRDPAPVIGTGRHAYPGVPPVTRGCTAAPARESS